MQGKHFYSRAWWEQHITVCGSWYNTNAYHLYKPDFEGSMMFVKFKLGRDFCRTKRFLVRKTPQLLLRLWHHSFVYIGNRSQFIWTGFSGEHNLCHERWFASTLTGEKSDEPGCSSMLCEVSSPLMSNRLQCLPKAVDSFFGSPGNVSIVVFAMCSTFLYVHVFSWFAVLWALSAAWAFPWILTRSISYGAFTPTSFGLVLDLRTFQFSLKPNKVVCEVPQTTVHTNAPKFSPTERCGLDQKNHSWDGCSLKPLFIVCTFRPNTGWETVIILQVQQN